MEVKIKDGSRRSEEEFKKLKEEVEKLMKKGIIEESDSDYAAVPFFVIDPSGKDRFVIDYRACQFDESGLENTILYDSRKFEQQAYTTTDREFLALLHVLEKYRYLLIDKKFVVYTDHLNLTYYKNMIDPPKRIIRSLDKLSEFNFEIRHIRGEDNVVADLQIKLNHHIAKQKIIRNHDPKTDCKRLILIDGNQITTLLEEAHSTAYSGHIANYKLGEKLRKSFYFPKFGI
ncbi:hypothetical protein ACTA71_009072 [Dictyostelium dimigraforme]